MSDGFLGMSEQMATFVIALLLQIVPLIAIVFYAVFCKNVDNAMVEKAQSNYSESGKPTNYGVATGFMNSQSRANSFYGSETWANDASNGYNSQYTYSHQLAINRGNTNVSRGSTTEPSRRSTSDLLVGDIQGELSMANIAENCGAFLVLCATVASTGIFHYTDFASDLGSTVTYYQAAESDNSSAVSEDHRYGFFFSSIFFILLYRFISTWFFYKARFPTRMCIRQFFDVELYRQVYESMYNNRYTKAMVYIKRFESVFEAFPQAMIALWFLLLTTKKDPVVLVSLIMSIWSISSSLSWSDDTAFKLHAYYGGFWWLRTTLRVCEVTSRLFVLAYCAVAFSPIFLLGILIFDFFSAWAIHLWDKHVHHISWGCCLGCNRKSCICCRIQTHADYNVELQTRDPNKTHQHVHKHVATYFKSIDNVLMFMIAVPSFSKDQLYIYMYGARIAMCVFCAGLSITYSELSREAGISEIDQVWVLFIGFLCLVAEVFLIYKIKDKVISEGGGDTIFKAARSNDIDKVLDDIQFGGIKIVGGKEEAAVNKKDRNNMKALHHAAAGGHIFLVNVLCDAMIKIEMEKDDLTEIEDTKKREIVDCQDFHGNTPINFSVIEGHEDALRVLLKFKSDPKGWSGFQEDTGKNLIHEAAERGFGRICENLVELPGKNGEDVDRLDQFRSWTPLMFACSKAGPIVYPFQRKIDKEGEKSNGNDEEELLNKPFQCQQLMGIMIEITQCDAEDLNEDDVLPDVICCFHENHNVKERKKKREVGLIKGTRMKELLKLSEKGKAVKTKCFNLGEVTWNNVWNPDEELMHKVFFKTASEETLVFDIRPDNLGEEQVLFLEKERIHIKFVVMDRYVYCVRELLRMGADTTSKGKNMETPMGLALRSRNMNIVSMLLNSRLEKKEALITRSEWKLASLNLEQYDAMLKYTFPQQFPNLVGETFEQLLDKYTRARPPPTLIRQVTRPSDSRIPVSSSNIRGATSPQQNKYNSALPDAYGATNNKWGNALDKSKRLAEQRLDKHV